MKRTVSDNAVVVTCLLFVMILAFAAAVTAEEQQQQPPAEPELVIVKYGSLFVKSSVSGAKVFVDDIARGSADDMIEGVVAGQHSVSCRTDSGTVSGVFQIKKNETLRLDARFEENKLVVYAVPVVPPVGKKKPAPAKQEKAVKPAAEAKKAEPKNPVDERRKTHLTVMRIEYDINAGQGIEVGHSAPSAVTKCAIKKSQAGKYYRTKQGVLLCDAGPCELTWNASFLYTDEKGGADALLLNWKEIVFNGITPKGTSRRELECCLNGKCIKMDDTSPTDIEQELAVGRYGVHWTKTSVTVRRADVEKEILNAGRSLADYAL